jgi:hypothetical protein
MQQINAHTQLLQAQAKAQVLCVGCLACVLRWPFTAWLFPMLNTGAGASAGSGAGPGSEQRAGADSDVPGSAGVPGPVPAAAAVHRRRCRPCCGCGRFLFRHSCGVGIGLGTCGRRGFGVKRRPPQWLCGRVVRC